MLGKSRAKKAVSQKQDEKRGFSIHRMSKNVPIWRHIGRRKICDMFWNLDMMRSNEKKNHQNSSTNKTSAGGWKSTLNVNVNFRRSPLPIVNLFPPLPSLVDINKVCSLTFEKSNWIEKFKRVPTFILSRRSHFFVGPPVPDLGTIYDALLIARQCSYTEKLCFSSLPFSYLKLSLEVLYMDMKY